MQTGRDPALREDVRENSARSRHGEQRCDRALPLAEFRGLHK